MTTKSKTKVMKMRHASSRVGIGVFALLQMVLLLGDVDAANLQPAASGPVRIDRASGGNSNNSVPWPAHWDSLFKCDFESGTTGCGGWTISNGNWKIDKPTRSPAPPHSGIYCALQDTAGNYAPGVDSRLITGTRGGKITLPTLAPGEELQLSFWHWYSFASTGYPCYADYGYVEISTDGGSTFTQLPGYSAFTGVSNGWYSPPPIDLSAYAGLQVRIAFRLVTTGCAEDRGWFVDDMVIRKGWDPTWSSLEYPNWETWQDGLKAWMVDSPLWQVGVPSNPPGPGPCGPTCSGGTCAATQLTTGYWPSANARLISPRVHLGSNPWLDFQHWYSFASSGYPCYTDYGYVEIAVCHGSGYGPWETKATFTGSSNGWTPAPSVDLTAYADSTVRIAFRLGSTGCAESRGWLVDDIQIYDAVTDVGGHGTASLPHAATLAQNVPNPFNPSTTIRFSTPATGEAVILVLDVAGRRVRTLMSGVVSAGQHECNWDGRNERGDAMPSGIYFYQLRTAAGTSTRHMVLVR